MSKGIFLGILAVTGLANLGLYILDKKQKLNKNQDRKNYNGTCPISFYHHLCFLFMDSFAMRIWKMQPLKTAFSIFYFLKLFIQVIQLYCDSKTSHLHSSVADNMHRNPGSFF